MLYAGSGIAVKTTYKTEGNIQNRIVDVAYYLDFIDAISEDEAYGKMIKYIFENSPSQEGWHTHSGTVRKVPTT